MEEEKDKPNNFVGMHGEVTICLLQNVGLGFVARDTAAKEQELQQTITFKVIRNDQVHENLNGGADIIENHETVNVIESRFFFF